MKRIVLLGLCVWLWAIGKTIATNTVTVGSVSVPQGGQAVMEITYSIDDAYEGYQLQLQMAEGSKVHPVMLGGKPLMSIDYTTHSLSCSNPSENLYNAVCVSLEDGPGKVLASSGTLMKVLLEADADATGSYNATLKTIKFAKTGNVEVSVADVDITITIGTQLPQVPLDENSTTAPSASDGPVDVTVTREINANEWSTICLPFDMSEAQVKMAFGDDVQLATLSPTWSFDGTSDNINKITLGFTDVSAIEKHHPYIIKVSNKITSFKVYNVVITTSNQTYSYSTYSTGGFPPVTYYAYMLGTYAKGSVPAKYFFLSGNDFWYSSGTQIKGFRATFVTMENSTVITLNSYSSSRIVMSFNEDETTGIRDNKRVTKDGKTYNLRGQQVEKPLKGLYIQDGKKVIIK